MKKCLLALLAASCLVGCATMTPEEAARLNALGDDMMATGQQFRSRQPQQSTCVVQDVGGGVYHNSCTPSGR